jgi:hypothetical protein
MSQITKDQLVNIYLIAGKIGAKKREKGKNLVGSAGI